MAGGGPSMGYGGYGNASLLGDGSGAASGAAGGYSGLASFGQYLSIAGAATAAAGAFYAAKANQYQLKSQALDLEFQRSMSNLNARNAEMDAQLELEAGKQEAGRVGLQYKQVQESARARTAAAGVEVGVGSAAETQASIAYAKEADLITINANAVRAANAARTRSVNYRNQGRMAGVGAANLRAGASAIRPFMSATSSLLGGAGDVARGWAANERASARYHRGGE